MKSKKSIILLTSLVLIILIATFIFTQTNKLGPEVVLFENGKVGNEILDSEPVIDKQPTDGADISSVHRFIDKIEFGIGDNAEELVEKWGLPLEVDYIYGGLYLKYEDVVFYTNGYITDDKTYFYGTIVTIEAKEGFGVKSGMLIVESRAILGEPDGMDIFDELKESGEGTLPSTDFYYRDDYTISVLYDKDTKQVYYVRLGAYRPTPDIVGGGFLELTDMEKDIYEDYILDYDDNKINGCTPMNIMKLWLYSLQENDYKAEWELYTKEENQFGWDQEYHMEIPDEHRMKDFSVFVNPVNIEVNYDENYKYATIIWEDKYLKEYDGSGRPSRYGFSLVKAKDRIWKVSFIPMQ